MAGAKASQTSLYEIIGVEKTASPELLQKAYKMRALQVHPDKNPEDPTANAAFQRLTAAYEVLKCPERRRLYDETGECDEDSLDSAARKSADAYIRRRFRPVTEESIRSFVEGYRFSAEERADLAALVRKSQGDVSEVMDRMLCSEAGDEVRFLSLVREMLKSGEVAAKLASRVDETTPALKRRAAALRRLAKRERKEVEAAATAGSSSEVGRSLVDLALAIHSRRQSSWATDIADALEAKYGGGPSGKKAKAKAKAASPSASSAPTASPKAKGKAKATAKAGAGAGDGKTAAAPQKSKGSRDLNSGPGLGLASAADGGGGGGGEGKDNSSEERPAKKRKKISKKCSIQG